MSDYIMPMVTLGNHRISRLIVGANPIKGGSHLSRFVNQQMKAYFTPSRVQEMLNACEQAGINVWQSGPGNIDAYMQHKKNGGALKFISLDHEQRDAGHSLTELSMVGTIAVAHHGEVTDKLFLEGSLDKVRPFLDKIRDAGMLAGVSTHIPEVVDRIEEAGWNVDFYMTCVYHRHRSGPELKALLGYVPIPEREVYLEEDPPRMWQTMRSTDKPCLAFKILAAGRLCDKPGDVESAFRDTFASIKPNDAAIVGMYPQYEDQIAMNSSYVSSYGR